ncbi:MULTISPECIES: peptidylprolyl isomerase [Hyphomicrobiales]|uniref:peptidylprolyl isomerase n=1 Tax=Hyphomicrobiales TaxID=356 RepID=UPI000423FEBA|nr:MULTISPECIES: peptidylprolyl isomerase [Hyphomicrobiales]CAH1655503.1 Peptidyl-prolyl cis-trans isomerase ppiD [Hyphomicrobiales bacterium]MBS7740395.1 peptidyl-prolyl cis-trans isomerase [Chelatococcus sp. HY11]MBX3544821.1 peptidyl-prolyl cis-trans isomerase [Chelatococcus sp.]MCO5078364.1 peptidylprolyl isomerase [Chelatococcus sp.]MCO5154692.1 peptidylprolyl isomerase [Shinella sp.]
MIILDRTARPEPVTVNGVTIAPEAIAAEAQNHPAPKGQPGFAWRAAARALALRETLLQEARAHDIAPEPIELEEGKWETEEEALIRQLFERTIAPAPVNEAPLRALYDAAPDRFRGPSLFEAAHILFAAAPGDAAGRASARQQAEAVLANLQRDPRRFAELAGEFSACSSRANGGMLGQLASGDTVPEFEAALCSMEEQSISDAPVESRYGFHLIRLDARVRGEVLPFTTVLPHLRQAQEKADWVRASRAYVEELAARYQVAGVDFAGHPAGEVKFSK